MPHTRNRLIWISLFICFLFSLLVAQFYHMQIIEGENWVKQAQKQHYFFVKEPAMRGTFYGNVETKSGHLPLLQKFVIDVPKYHLYADPQSIPNESKGMLAKELISRILLPIDQLSRIEEQLRKRGRSRILVSWLDQETHNEIHRWWQAFARENRIPRNALYFVKDYQRSYPFGKLLGQVLHTIQIRKNEKTGQALPTGGLELYFNSYLQGKNGKKKLMRSPRHSFEIGEVITPPEHGADIYLTINPCLQAIAEEEIERGVKKSKGKAGWAAMMNPHTGEILAIAQYPFFYPPHYQRYFNDTNSIEHTKVKAVTDANEPGSVCKPITAIIALKANQELQRRGETPLFSPQEKISTSSGRFPGRSKPIQDTSSSRFLNLNMAMQKSSNIYMGRLIERVINRMGASWYRDQLKLFGFGQKTHIELPAESSGVLPTPGKLHPNGKLEWSLPTPFSLAMGYNNQVTTIQLLRVYSVLANGGFLVQPTLVRSVVKKNEKGERIVLIDHTTENWVKQFPRIVDSLIVTRVLEAMRYVTKPGGTAQRADIPGYTEVGKTSTTKKNINGKYSEKLYCATFAGFAPVSHPAFVLVVTIDEPEYGYIPGIGKNHNGGNCTAQVFRQIAKRSLEYLGIPQDDPYGYPYGDPSRDPSKEAWMKETKELQELYRLWNQK